MLAGTHAEIEGVQGAEVTGLAYDSRAAGPGDLYFCVVGERADGHDFAPRVVAAGAAALAKSRARAGRVRRMGLDIVDRIEGCATLRAAAEWNQSGGLLRC